MRAAMRPQRLALERNRAALQPPRMKTTLLLHWNGWDGSSPASAAAGRVPRAYVHMAGGCACLLPGQAAAATIYSLQGLSAIHLWLHL